MHLCKVGHSPAKPGAAPPKGARLEGRALAVSARYDHRAIAIRAVGADCHHSPATGPALIVILLLSLGIADDHPGRGSFGRVGVRLTTLR